MRRIAVLLWAVASLLGASEITIEQFGAVKVAYSSEFNQVLFFQNGMNSMNSHNLPARIEEEDLPVELHRYSGSNVMESGEAIGLPAVIEAPSTLVALIDSGVDLKNEQLRSYLYTNTAETAGNGIDDDRNGYNDDVTGFDMMSATSSVQDVLGHGTLMAGVIANSSGGRARILPIKVFDDQGRSSQFVIASAINYAVNRGAKVINCSFGYAYSTEVLKLAIQDAVARGVVVIASAGNNGLEKMMYPAALPGVVAVSSLDGADHLANFSNYGAYLTLSCPGVDILSTYLNNQTSRVSGTSVSAAYASGLLSALNSSLSRMDISVIGKTNVKDIIDPKGDGQKLVGWDKYTGNGKLQIEATPQVATSSATEVRSLLNYPNPVSDLNGTQLGYELSRDANVSIKLYNLAGRMIWSQSVSSGGAGAKEGYNKVMVPCTDQNGQYLPNDTYIVLVKAEGNGQSSIARTFLSVAR